MKKKPRNPEALNLALNFRNTVITNKKDKVRENKGREREKLRKHMKKYYR
jgi:hypothetical protein